MCPTPGRPFGPRDVRCSLAIVPLVLFSLFPGYLRGLNVGNPPILTALPLFPILNGWQEGARADHPQPQESSKETRENEPQRGEWNGWKALDEVAERMKFIGPWEPQVPLLDRSLTHLWEQNRWHSESDQFALNLGRELVRIPPWHFSQRMDLFTQRLGDRYGLTADQAAGLKIQIMREAGLLMMKHAPVVFDQISRISTDLEAQDVESYMQGIQSQMAQMTMATQVMHREALAVVDRLAGQLASQLGEEQRRRFEVDWQTALRIRGYVDTKRAAWAEGRWSPEDFGIPIEEFNHGVALALEKGGGVSPAQAIVSATVDAANRAASEARLIESDPFTWYVYLKKFNLQWVLDPGQLEAGASILNESVERAVERLTRREEGADRGRIAEARRAEILKMFEWFKSRLDGLLTTEQRARGQKEGEQSEKNVTPEADSDGKPGVSGR